MRILESLAEQLQHSPEFVAAFFHKVRFGKDGSKPIAVNLKDKYVIDYSFLHRGIQELNKNPNPYTGGVNFDDLNEFAYHDDPLIFEQYLQDEPLPEDDPGSVRWATKTFNESTSLAVILDILGNFELVFTIKMWGMMMAWYLWLGFEDPRNGPWWMIWAPRYRRQRSLQQFAIVDAFVFLTLELFLLAHGIKQGRLVRGNDDMFKVRRFTNLALAVVGCGAMYVSVIIPGGHWKELTGGHWKDLTDLERRKELADMDMDWSPTELTAIMTCFVYFVARGIIIACLSWRKQTYLNGRPSEEAVPSVMDIIRADTSRDFMAEEAPASQFDSALEMSLSLGETLSSRMPIDHEGSLAVEDITITRDEKDGQLARMAWIAWVAMASVCFLFEIFLVAPLASAFEWQDFCGTRCHQRNSFYKGGLTVWQSHMVGSDCMACSGTLISIWALVAITAIFDIYFVFYLGTAICGFIMGEARGLRGCLSPTGHETMDMVTRCEDRDKYRSDAASGRASPGESMKFVFGQGWRLLWSQIVEALHADCLINDRDATKMVQAAQTVRFNKKDKADDVAKPSHKFSKLKFTSLKARGNAQVHISNADEVTHCISSLCIRFKDGTVDEFPTTDKKTSDNSRLSMPRHRSSLRRDHC